MSISTMAELTQFARHLAAYPELYCVFYHSYRIKHGERALRRLCVRLRLHSIRKTLDVLERVIALHRQFVGHVARGGAWTGDPQGEEFWRVTWYLRCAPNGRFFSYPEFRRGHVMWMERHAE